MSKLTNRIGAVAREATDAVVALIEAAWPRSMPSREIGRLTHDGYPAGAACDVFFLLSFDGGSWESALDELNAAGFMVRDGAGNGGAFVTVKTRIRLRSFELSLAGARLERIVTPHGGFSTLIGPAVAARHAVPAPDARRQPLVEIAQDTETLSGAA